MIERIINENEAGQRLDKYLHKVLPGAPSGFLYKMLRKKNITLNGHKASGSEKTSVGDEIRFFLSEDTFGSFAGKQTSAYRPKYKGEIPQTVYEDEHVLILNKPAGVLSQPDISGEPSMVEYVTDYLVDKGDLSALDLQTFRPSVVNRLDRNTSGLIAAGKTLAALQELSEAIRSRSVRKFYQCLVRGSVSEQKLVKGYLHKDEKSNIVSIRPSPGQGDKAIVTEYKPISHGKSCTLLQVELITGRTHQIRAHLASQGFPVLGDPKYGDAGFNRRLIRDFDVHHQLLHCGEMDFGETGGALSELSGRKVECGMPVVFEEILKTY